MRHPESSHLAATRVIQSPHGVIIKDPDILGGTPVFRGTRVPIQTLFDYLEGGETLEDFLEGFPTISREMLQTGQVTLTFVSGISAEGSVTLETLKVFMQFVQS